MDHKAYIRRVAGTDTAVLLIHGIVGTPRQFDGLLDLFPEHWSIYNILLDGHGGSVKSFSRSSMKAWKAQVSGLLTQLCANYEKVMLVGHSMGTLLALEQAMDHPQVKTLFLMNVPLCPRLKLTMAVRSLGLALGLVSREDPLACATSITPDWQLWRYLGWIPRYLELFRLCSQSKKRLSVLKKPAFALQSAKDELVSNRSDRYLRLHPWIRHTSLENSGHFVYASQDMQTLRHALAECVEITEK